MKFLTQLIILAILHKSSITKGEEDVKVKDNAPCWKGKSHTLTCEVKNRTPEKAIEWMNGNDVIPIIHCNNNTCLLNPRYEGKYTKSCDLKKNIFNLTILDVEKDYSNKKFVCSDGTNSGCTILNVVDLEEPSLDETEDGKITATSACSSLDKKVSFKWIKIDIVSNKEDEFKPKILYTNVTDCSNECGNRIKYTEAISVMSSGHGTKYYLKMAIDYGTEIIVSEKNTLAYIIEEQAEIDSKLENFVLIPVILVVIVAAAVIVPIFWKIRKRHALTYYGSNVKGTGNPNEGNEVINLLLESGPLPVIDLKAEPYLTSLMISWKSQSTSKQSGFIVTYQEMPAGVLVKLPDLVSVENQTDYSITIPDLFPGCTYKVNVQALQNVSGKRVGSPLQEIMGTTDMETFNGIIMDYNGHENTVDEVPCASHKAEGATVAAAGIKSRDEHMNLHPSLNKIFGKDTNTQIFEKTGSTSVDLSKRSDKEAISRCHSAHLPNTEYTLPMPDMSMTFLTSRSTEEESKGSVERTPIICDSCFNHNVTL